MSAAPADIDHSGGISRTLLNMTVWALRALLAWLAVTTLWHARQPVYDLSTGDLVAVGVAVSAAWWGSTLLSRSLRAGLALGALGTAILWGATILGAASIGLFVAPFALVSTLVFAVASRGNPGGTPAGAVAVASSLAVVLWIAPWSPLVECGASGGSSRGSSRSSSSSSGWGVAGPNGNSSGHVVEDGGGYSYRCEGGDLVEFRSGSGPHPPRPDRRGSREEPR